MVANSDSQLGMAVELNFARGFLFRAADALNDGRLLEAGVLLRESVRRQLWAECCWKGCLPEGASAKTPPFVLLKALRIAGYATECGDGIARDIITIGNRAAHCRRVSAGDLRTAIIMFHRFIDNDPCMQPANLAGVSKVNCGFESNAEYDDDDCDDEGGALVKGGAK